MASAGACFIGAQTRVNGRITGSESLVVAGRIEGAVTLDGALTVEPGAEVTADVSVTLLTVRGTFTGSVVASEGVRLEAGSRVVGDIRTPQLTIADGAAYRGNIDMDVTLPAGAGGRAGA